LWNLIAPQLTEPPTLDQQKGMLHLKGYFPSRDQFRDAASGGERAL
jgi:hypothetical protein